MPKQPIVLKNAAVAAKYTTDSITDPIVHVCGHWKGNLSGIPIEAADAFHKMGTNLLALKTPPGTTAKVVFDPETHTPE